MASVDAEKGYQQGPPPMYPGTDPSNTSLPPPYSQTVHDPTEPPPTYESLYGKVKAAKSESSGVADFLKRFVLLLAGTSILYHHMGPTHLPSSSLVARQRGFPVRRMNTGGGNQTAEAAAEGKVSVGCTILIGVVMAVPIAMIVMGALHLQDCPAERFIPIYLVVAGTFWSFLSVMSLIKRCLCSSKDEEEGQEGEKKRSNPCEAIINTFMFVWFIAGNVWVYRTYGHYSTDPTDLNYCHPTLYLFAFWLITATYIMFGALCCCMALSGCVAVLVNTE